MPDKRTRGPQTAAEFLRELESDPKWRAAHAERLRVWALGAQANLAETAPLRAELHRRLDIDVDTINLVQDHPAYVEAISILIAWLPKVSRPNNKAAIAHALTSPKARPQAASVLLDEFRRAKDVGPNSARWVIGDALEVVADDLVFDRVEAILRNPGYGVDRFGVVRSLIRGRKNPRVEPLLRDLLDDPDIAGMAAYVLVRRGVMDIDDQIDQLVPDPNEFISAWAQRARELVDKRRAREAGGE